MKKSHTTLVLSASDLSNHAACAHRTQLDLAALSGRVIQPGFRFQMPEILQERGRLFEEQYLDKLKSEGHSVFQPIENASQSTVDQTIAAMHRGEDIIYQAALRNDRWQGRADFLRKVAKESDLGNWAYEVYDSKLAQETRTGTILQLCLYSELVASIQGVMPQYMHVITPEEGITKQSYRLDDFLAYYRLEKKRLEKAVMSNPTGLVSYPTPCDHCDICSWWQHCDTQRRQDDHLSYVAGLSNTHVNELSKQDILTLQNFAQTPLPLPFKPTRGVSATYTKLREQARVQLQARETGDLVLEKLALIEGQGLYRLPAPSQNDMFFDLEGDPFVGTGGLEYLVGWTANDANASYRHTWAFNATEEKLAFEQFIDEAIMRWEDDPGMHIYHFTGYESGALKRLMGKYATRENEVDRLLRGGRLIDLHGITKQSLRIGLETYSLKELERFHRFNRNLDLKDAASAKRVLEELLERNDPGAISQKIKEQVALYNQEDCLSTQHLRNWLEEIRDQWINEGKEISRPVSGTGQASEQLTEHQQRVTALYDQLTIGIAIGKQERSKEEQARWLLANMLDWYRRESKAGWWEYFRLCELGEEELLEEKAALAGLTFKKQLSKTPRGVVVDEYQFEPQEFDIKVGDEVKATGGSKLGTVKSIDAKARLISVEKGSKVASIHPTSIFQHSEIPDKVKEEAIFRIASWVAANEIDASGDYRAARDLLLNYPPRTKTVFTYNADPQQKAVQWLSALTEGVLPIQGPPGAGKSHTAAQMIIDLLKQGKKIGITAMSHKVITELLHKTLSAIEKANSLSKEKIQATIYQKVSTLSLSPVDGITEVKDNPIIVDAILSGAANVAAGTPWLWAREDLFNSVDVLIVDEAGQLSLIDTIAVSQATKNLVLLGDPQQLQQPQQGTHPEGTEVSALEHILDGKKTIEPDKGIFLDTTWRMHPKVCELVSELFYDNRLEPQPALINQAITGTTQFSGAGLFYVPVQHAGNQSSSTEESNAVKAIVAELLNGSNSFTNSKKENNPLTALDIKVIAPYNAQVSLLNSVLPDAIQVGTVDKFQGQESPVIIFSMATSTPQDAPRGMDFLYSLNRLNVAVSRARATFILVGSPALFEPDCKHVIQMKLANAYCRFLETAKTIHFKNCFIK